MKHFTIEALEPNTICTRDVMLADSYMLLSPQIPMTSDLRNRLIIWEFHELQTEGTISSSKEIPTYDADTELEIDTAARDSMIAVQRCYRETAQYLDDFFGEYKQTNSIDINKIIERIRLILEPMRLHRAFFLRFDTMKEETNHGLLVEISVKVALLVMAIGIELKMPSHRLIDVGSAAILHKIGMLHIPLQIELVRSSLSPEQHKQLLAHPIVAFRAMKQSQVNPTICATVLESNERFDGSGHPRHLKGDQISNYGRLLSVAIGYIDSTYLFIDGTAYDGHVTIVNMLKHRNILYDGTILKALIGCLSFYPLGCIVQLENGYYGMVVASNAANLRAPIVQLLAKADGTRLTLRQSMDTTKPPYRITRAVRNIEALGASPHQVPE